MNEKKLRILLAEGNSGETVAALRELYPEGQNGLELTNVSSVSTLIATLEIAKPEVIFLDLSLAHADPLEAVRRVHRSAPEVPLIVLADGSDRNCAARSLGQGALNYLIKGFIDRRTLEGVLRTALEHNTFEGLTDLLRDPLTGLYIRDGFLTLGERAMETAKRNESTLVLLCMRIENLAMVRAGYGSNAAEKSLRGVATLLSGSFRRTDIVTRLEESQFAALAVDAIEPSGSGALPARGKAHRRAQSRHGAVGPARTPHQRTFLVSQGKYYVFSIFGECRGGVAVSTGSVYR